MDMAALRAVYDREMRMDAQFPDYEKEFFPNLVRMVNRTEHEGFIPYSRLTEEEADRVIAEQMQYFRDLNMEYEWKYYSYDTPADLKGRLAAHGLEVGEDEAIMVLEIEQAPERLHQPVTRDIRKITDPDEAYLVQKLVDEVYQEEHPWLTPEFRRRLIHYPDTIGIFMAYQDEKPVAAGWSFYYPKCTFAGLYGGSTLAPYRRQGIYTDLVAVRMQDAIAHGMRFLTVDAGEESQPILEKLGFRQIAVSNPCQWKPAANR